MQAERYFFFVICKKFIKNDKVSVNYNMFPTTDFFYSTRNRRGRREAEFRGARPANKIWPNLGGNGIAATHIFVCTLSTPPIAEKLQATGNKALKLL